jgi:hypothetical protein
VPVHKSQQPLQYLMTEISLGRLKLPEIQRAYVWKPTQVANLVESLDLGYPTGSLLLWQTDEPPQERALDIGERQAAPAGPPRYLLDGQQRLTSLHRALRRDEHLDQSKFIEIVFNVTNGSFENESAATKKDSRWVRVATDAAAEAGTYRRQGTRWLFAAGGVRARRGRDLKGRCLTLPQREEIGLGRARGESIRTIATAIGRAPSTVSRELRRNSDGSGFTGRRRRTRWRMGGRRGRSRRSWSPT